MGPCMCGGCPRCLHDQGYHCGNEQCAKCGRPCPVCGAPSEERGQPGNLLQLKCRSCDHVWAVKGQYRPA